MMWTSIIIQQIIIFIPKNDMMVINDEILERICREVERLSRLVEQVRGSHGQHSLVTFVGNCITELRINDRIRTAETYVSTLNSFMNFRQGRDMTLEQLTPEVVENYEAWMRKRGLIPNTTSFYMRILRAVYNRAVERGMVSDCRPFRHVYTGIDKTVKRALTLPQLRTLRRLDLDASPAVDYARDMFLMSLYLRGMSFIDMAYLRKCDLCGGHIVYRRRKTGRMLIIKWTAEMEQIVNKYPLNPSKYLLPIIRTDGGDGRRDYLNAAYNINRHLKLAAAMMGMTSPLTLYVARHTWASVAKIQGVPLNVISEGLGHGNADTTQIYLAALDNTVIDRANSRIIDSL